MQTLSAGHTFAALGNSDFGTGPATGLRNGVDKESPWHPTPSCPRVEAENSLPNYAISEHKMIISEPNTDA